MPLVSVNILTKNRAELLQKAVLSVEKQNFKDYEIVIIDDGSTDNTQEIIERFKDFHLRQGFGGQIKILTHPESRGITASRQEALLASRGEYIAVLDDDDEWVDPDKLNKQVEYFKLYPDAVLVGGGIQISNFPHFAKASWDRQFPISKKRPETDKLIRKTMLLRNNFFTSTVMFRKEAAVKTGGFVKDQDDFAEDYDLWLRLGQAGKMYNFPGVFAAYRQPSYNKERLKAFFRKQLRLIKNNCRSYPYYWLVALILKIRILFNGK